MIYWFTFAYLNHKFNQYKSSITKYNSTSPNWAWKEFACSGLMCQPWARYKFQLAFIWKFIIFFPLFKHTDKLNLFFPGWVWGQRVNFATLKTLTPFPTCGWVNRFYGLGFFPHGFGHVSIWFESRFKAIGSCIGLFLL